MENVLNIAKAFLESIMIIFIKDTNNKMGIVYDPKGYTLFNVVIVNPTNKKKFECKTLIDNMSLIDRGKVGLWTKYNFLMEILIDHLYSVNDDETTRIDFANTFSTRDIKLLIDYFGSFPSFKLLSEKYEKG